MSDRPTQADRDELLAQLDKLPATAERVKQLTDHVVEFAEHLLAGHPTSVEPQLFIVTKPIPAGDEEMIVTVFAIDFNDDAVKEAALAKMAQDVFDRQRVPIVICFLSEAWTVTRARETLRDAGARRPAECEDRRECLIVTAQSLKRELTDGAIIRVDREDGKMYARPAERMTPGTIGGNILRYFWDGYGRALYRSLSAEHQAEIRRDQAERDRNRAAKN